jgi:predicted nucleotidyltransferase component of viral defense system
MSRTIYNSLQLRELFHLEFLRWFGRKCKTELYALKGGVNLRFFFKSSRYSEDMDLDIQGLKVEMLKDTVMGILEAKSFGDVLKVFGIERVVSPDIKRAKQTETTQRFKIHLITLAGEDLFTKIEFPRRGFKGRTIVQPVSDAILRVYKLAPLLVPHYDIDSTLMQKIDALASRSIIQARDIFDLYTLSSQYEPFKTKTVEMSRTKLTKAYENMFEISFEQFRDTVISYLLPEDQKVYDLPSVWDEVRLKVGNLIEDFKNNYE